LSTQKLTAEKEAVGPNGKIAGKYGDFSEVTKRIAAQAGNTLVLTAESGSNVPSPAGRLDLKRWGADIGADELCFIVSGGPAFSGYARRTFRH